jgi:Tol biopolymer transport system component
MILERGTLLIGRYRIVEVLGQGGMGSVYRAMDENLGVEVAVKDNLFTTEEYARQFRREAQILASLRHPNLPRVTDHFVINGQGQYLVMDYIEGEDLRQRMDREGLLGDDEVIVIGAAICDALAYLSSLNPIVVHRDIKPGNVKITPQGQIYLVDFGLAKVVQGSEATSTGARAMTPGYSPPEQYGTARTDPRSDIFSLGATLYAALGGTIPEDALARAMDHVELTPVRTRNPNVSRRLAAVIERSLALKPDDRYQSPEDFKLALLNARSTSRRRLGENWQPPLATPERGARGEYVLPPVVVGAPVSTGAAPFTPDSLEEEARPAPDTGAARRRARRALLLAVGALLLVALLGWALGLGRGRPTASATPPPLSPSPLPRTTATLPLVAPLQSSPTPSLTIAATATALSTPTVTLMPTPMGGGGGQLAFASDSTGLSQIYTINIDGTGLSQVTDVFGGACQPAWSPDGQQLVFISPCETNHETYTDSGLFLINVDGTGLKPLTILPGGDYDPDWSPDGSKIVFTSVRNSGRPQIYVYDMEAATYELLSQTYDRDMQPTWNRDGSQILFVTARRGPYQIYVMDADGSNQRPITPNREGVYVHPSWGADEKFILFTKLANFGSIPQLVIAPVSGDYSEYRITQTTLPMREGRYSPDGMWIAFEGWPAGQNHDIFIVAANGGGLQKITSDPRADFDVAWKPLPLP